MARAVVLQTQADAPAGLLADWAARRGIELDVVRVDLDEPLPDPHERDFAVALGSGATAAGGGPPWVEREIEWLRVADAAGLPVLGICFGAQVLAAALGGCVRRLERPEVGWVTVETADAEHLPAGPWLAWHEAGFTLPPLASELASNAFGVQAFCLGRHLAVQFHPEVTPAIVRDWADEDHGDLDRAGSTREALDAATAEHAANAARAAEKLFDSFAARAGLVAVASRV
jgi:GMP synthase-like glutamine amidotransferase